jgi:hypothetical protein
MHLRFYPEKNAPLPQKQGSLIPQGVALATIFAWPEFDAVVYLGRFVDYGPGYHLQNFCRTTRFYLVAVGGGTRWVFKIYYLPYRRRLEQAGAAGGGFIEWSHG